VSGSGLPGESVSRWRRALVYFGLAEDDPANPLYPRPGATEPRGGADTAALTDILRKLDEQSIAIDALRAEVERLRERERDGV
jgi:hypothetical protein